jgi:hypothetical protein
LTIDDAIRQCNAALATSEAFESIGREPYWPKWNSPWWHMTLLWEMGEAARIPRIAAEAMTHHYIRIFPIGSEDLPPGRTMFSHAPAKPCWAQSCATFPRRRQQSAQPLRQS